MLEMMPFKKNKLARRDEGFLPFFKNYFNDDLFTSLSTVGDEFKVDLKETEDNYMVEAELPGVKKEDITVDVKNNYLEISAKREEETEDKKENYVRRERYYGEVKRTFYVDNIDREKIEASFENGVLKITLPKVEKGKVDSTKIEIK